MLCLGRYWVVRVQKDGPYARLLAVLNIRWEIMCTSKAMIKQFLLAELTMV